MSYSSVLRRLWIQQDIIIINRWTIQYLYQCTYTSFWYSELNALFYVLFIQNPQWPRISILKFIPSLKRRASLQQKGMSWNEQTVTRKKLDLKKVTIFIRVMTKKIMRNNIIFRFVYLVPFIQVSNIKRTFKDKKNHEKSQYTYGRVEKVRIFTVSSGLWGWWGGPGLETNCMSLVWPSLGGCLRSVHFTKEKNAEKSK